MPQVLRKGSRIGKYRIDRRIGRGAFAEVWKGRDTVENRPVALKIAHPDSVKEWGRDAIEHEARIASRLDHPNVVAIRNADWIDGHFIMVTDLAVANLATYTKARRSAATALGIIRQITCGLGYAHAQRILHRDVKPENVLIFADGRAALGDFGASRFAKGVTQTYTEAGTLGYMAPEQAYGRPRFSSDVFAVGLIGYELLTGVLLTWPFDWPPDGYRRFQEKVPEAIRRVLRKAAEFEPSRRYADARVFHAALEKAFARVEETPRPRAVRRRRKKNGAPSPLAVHSEAFRRAHGKALGLRFACHRCEGPIAEAMRFCPWCGSDENSFIRLSGSSLVCPDCEKGVRPEWTACPWCYSGRFEGNGRKPPPDLRATRSCSARGCEGVLQPFMRYCPLCKQKTRRVWSHPDLPDRCPRCRWPTSHAFLRYCPWCGRHEPRAGAFVRSRS